MSTARRLAFLTLALLLPALLAAPALASPTTDARKAAKEARWLDAADAWMKVLEKDATNREAALGLAEAVTKGNLTDFQVRAADALLDVLEKKEDDRVARLALGDLFIATALTKTDQQAMKNVFEDAKQQFATLLEADANDEEAAVGLARTHFWTAYFSDALQVLDDYLASNKSKGPALYWKGKIFYQQALDAYRAAGQIDAAAKELFQKARGSYEAACAAKSDDFDAWLQLGYACQYIGDLEASQEAYEKAMQLDGDSMMPLKGIEALYTYRPKEYRPTLEALAKKYANNNAVWFFLGFDEYSKGEYDAAIKSLSTFIDRSKEPGVAYHYLGRALDAVGREDDAREAYVKALEANPNDEASADQLDAKLQQEYAATAGASLTNAKATVAAYKKLFDLAPTASSPRQNAAFILREAFARHQNDKSWMPILDECIRLYEEATGLIEKKIAGREETLDDATLWNYAGVINDTGLMFQYYPAREDLEKAENYYIRALELTGDGYGDAFGNLVMVYQKQGRYQEAYELARDCAETLRNADGTPHPARQKAQQIRDQLANSGKVEVD